MAGPLIELEQYYEMTGYVKMISGRLSSLQKDVEVIDSRLSTIESRAKGNKKMFKQSVGEIKQKVTTLKDGVKDVQTVMVMMIGEMKNLLKSTDFERFEKRLDMWAPESLVTRDEAMRIILKR